MSNSCQKSHSTFAIFGRLLALLIVSMTLSCSTSESVKPNTEKATDRSAGEQAAPEQQQASTAQKNQEALRLLVVRGGHSYDTPEFEDMFRAIPDVESDLVLTSHFEGMTAKSIQKNYDAILFLNQNKKYTTTDHNRKRYLDLAELGVGMVFLHFTLSSEPEWDEYHDLVGGKWSFKHFEKDPKLHSTFFTNMTLDVKVLAPNHPTTDGLSDFTMTDAFYGNIAIAPGVQPLLGTTQPDISSTIAWAHKYKNSKVVYFMPGFTKQAYENESYRKFIANSIAFVSSDK